MYLGFFSVYDTQSILSITLLAKNNCSILHSAKPNEQKTTAITCGVFMNSSGEKYFVYID